MNIHPETKEVKKQKTSIIFIVEDNAVYAKLLETMLESKFPGLTTIKHFTNGEACLLDLYQNPAVIIIDHLLNTNDSGAATGLSIIKKVVNASPDTNIILLTAQKEFDVISKTITKYGCTYIQKDEQSFNKVEHLVRGVLATKE